MLSSRASPFLTPPFSYIQHHIGALANQYGEGNERGTVSMAVAENRLMSQVLLSRLQSFPGYSADALNYTNPTGLPLLKEQLCSFLQDYVFRACTVRANELVVAPGCCALLHQLALLLFEVGDGVLVPTPYYPAFDIDFRNIGGVRTIEVNCDPDGLPSMALTTDAFDEAWERAALAGCTVKAVLLTNPSNPLGGLYTTEQLQLIIDWAASKDLHLIVDEIYALSVFSGTFVSVASLLARSGQTLGEKVHCMWSLSKDFGASGLRLGVLYSNNNLLLDAMAGCTDAMQVSNCAQQLVAYMLSDRAFVDSYLEENKRLLQCSYQTLAAGLASCKLDVVPASCGIFALADLRPLLLPHYPEAETELEMRLVRSGVVLTPGRVCHCQRPGFFRVCYASVSIEALREGIARIAEIAAERML
jgi:1-aminocyclopropane-1-carboxylate synthase